MSTEKTNIKFISVSILEALEKKRLIKYLRQVTKGEDGFPIYSFKNTDKVAECVATFRSEQDVLCDRSFDGDAWKYYKENILNAKTSHKTITTRNYNVVRRIFEEGYACMLCKCGVDQYKKKFFVFYKNDVIASIKSEEDTKRKAEYEKKQQEVKTEEIPDTEIGKLIEKAMEEDKNEQ